MFKTKSLLRFAKFTAIVVLCLAPLTAFADGSFICAPTEGANTQNDVKNCVLNIRNVAFIVAAIAAVGIITFAGYLYIFAAGNESNVGKAKSLIQGAITGLVILLAGGLLLEQINPDLLNIRSISPQQIVGQRWYIDKTDEDDQGYIIPRAGGATPGRSDKLESTSCAIAGSDCPNITQATGLQCKDGCTAQRAIVNKLAELKRLTPGVNWIVTEAYPPTVVHKDKCHQTGSCVDIALRPSDDGSNPDWVKMCSAIKQISGVGMLNEISAGFANECGKFVNRTAAHISFFLVSGAPAASSQVVTNSSATWPTGQVQGNNVTCNGGTATRANENARCTEYSNEIKNASTATGLSVATIRTLIHIESGFNMGSTSGKGAIGLMQITPATASQYNCSSNWSSNAQENINCGAKIFKALISKYGNKVPSAIAEYNGGSLANYSSADCNGLVRWQCAFDNPEKTVCNTGYVETRNYALNYNALATKYQSSCPN